MPYTCQCCFKQFKRKYWYDRHCLWCDREEKVLNREKLDSMTEVPTQHHMFEMILDMKNKIEAIDKKVNNKIAVDGGAKRKVVHNASKQDMSTVKDGCEYTCFFKELDVAFYDAVKILSHPDDVDARGGCHGIGYGIAEYIVSFIMMYDGDASDAKPLLYRSQIIYVFSDGLWKILSYKALNTIINLFISKLSVMMQDAFSYGCGDGGDGGDGGGDGDGGDGGGDGDGGGYGRRSFDIDLCFRSISIEEYMEYTQKLMYDISSTQYGEKYIKFLHKKLSDASCCVSQNDISIEI